MKTLDGRGRWNGANERDITEAMFLLKVRDADIGIAISEQQFGQNWDGTLTRRDNRATGSLISKPGKYEATVTGTLISRDDIGDWFFSGEWRERKQHQKDENVYKFEAELLEQ